jgi:STE24 endopeptidase
MDFASTAAIFLFAPEILRHVMQTRPLPDSPLRSRLHEICQRSRIRYRDILLWQTSHQVSNAAVMGFVPQARYVLLSDLLIDTMTDEQIEAVFAHELGHVIHRHLYWLAGTVIALSLLFSGPAADLGQKIVNSHPMPEWVQWVLFGGMALGIGAALFGYVSRRFERQADVFAARTLEGFTYPDPPKKPDVGPHGAMIFISALRKVAATNNMPITAPSWSHGSIAGRMQFLAELGENPPKTLIFDRSMSLLYLILSLSIAICMILAIFS